MGKYWVNENNLLETACFQNTESKTIETIEWYTEMTLKWISETEKCIVGVDLWYWLA